MRDKRVCKISFPYSEKIKQTKLKRSTRGIKVSLWGIEPSWSIGYHIFRFVSIRIDLTRRLKSGHGEKEVESISEFFLASVFIFDFHFRLDTKIKPHITKWFERTNEQFVISWSNSWRNVSTSIKLENARARWRWIGSMHIRSRLHKSERERENERHSGFNGSLARSNRRNRTLERGVPPSVNTRHM